MNFFCSTVRGVIASLSCGFLCGGQAEAQCLRYSLQLIQPPNCGIILPVIYPQCISPNGRICGWRHDCNSDPRAFWWNGGGVITLTLPSPTTQGRALALNSANQIVGYMRSPTNSTSRAFLYQNGQAIDLGTLPGHLGAEALSINENGVIVGNSNGAYPCVWQDGIPSLLKLPMGPHGVAYDINDSNQVVEAIRKPWNR